MNETGHDARDTFFAGPDYEPPGLDLLQEAREQVATTRPDRRHRMRVLATAVAAVAAAGVTAALLAGSGSGAPSPLAAVTGALARTSAESYSFSLDSTTQLAGRQMHSSVVSGTIDRGSSSAPSC